MRLKTSRGVFKRAVTLCARVSLSQRGQGSKSLKLSSNCATLTSVIQTLTASRTSLSKKRINLIAFNSRTLTRWSILILNVKLMKRRRNRTERISKRCKHFRILGNSISLVHQKEQECITKRDSMVQTIQLKKTSLILIIMRPILHQLTPHLPKMTMINTTEIQTTLVIDTGLQLQVMTHLKPNRKLHTTISSVAILIQVVMFATTQPNSKPIAQMITSAIGRTTKLNVESALRNMETNVLNVI